MNDCKIPTKYDDSLFNRVPFYFGIFSAMELPEKTVFFDGVCNLCNASVDFMVRRDARRKLRFASLQGATGQALLKEKGWNTEAFDSFIFVENGRVFTESTAALKVAQVLGGPLRLTGVFFVVPPFIRNAAYRFLAKNRYKWFGKKESCRLPSPEERAVFLD